MTATDATLVSRTQDGDDEAFRALYERHRPSVERVCRKWLRDPYLVEDAVQATFVKAWTALPRFEGGADVDRWLRTIARNHCHDVWRGTTRAEVLGRPEGADGELVDLASARLAAECVDRVAVETMLRNLGRRDASLLVQRHIGESSVGALAAHWGLTRGAMDVALHRARLRARRLAIAEGLRGLAPLGLLRRLGSMLQRLNSYPLDGGAVIFGVCNIVIAATLGTVPAPPAMADEPAQGPTPFTTIEAWASAVSEPDVDVQRRTKSARVRPARDRRGEAIELAISPVSSPNETRRKTRIAGPRPAPSAMSFEPVAVPGTGRSIRSEPTYDEPDWTIGARAGPEEIGMEEGATPIAPESQPIVEVGCTAANAGSPVTFCED